MSSKEKIQLQCAYCFCPLIKIDETPGGNYGDGTFNDNVVPTSWVDETYSCPKCGSGTERIIRKKIC